MRVSRRRFLQKFTGVITASSVASFVPYHFTSSLFAADEKTTQHKIGCIGVGEEGKYIMPGAMKCGEVVAVCDVDKKHLEVANELAGGKAAMYGDYQRILDDKSINAVVIATPDHWHTKISVEAMRAGKHVYCEKPLTLTIDEGKLISKVQKETKMVFQVGTQQRSEHNGVDDKKNPVQLLFLQAVGLAHSGRLGKIQRIHCFIGGAPACNALPKADVPSELNWDKWLGQAPMTDYLFLASRDVRFGESRVHNKFRWWFEYSGGKMTDWGAHHVDIATWMLNKGDSGPVKIEPVMAKFPMPYKNGMPTENNRYNTATHFEIKCTYADGTELIICDAPKPEQKLPKNGIFVEAEKGTLFVNRDKILGPIAMTLKDDPISAEMLTKLYKGKKTESYLGSHMRNFFDCIESGGEPVSDVHTHHRAMTTCHLANLAIRLNRTLSWDPAKEEIVGDSEARAMQSREQRKGYEITA